MAIADKGNVRRVSANVTSITDDIIRAKRRVERRVDVKIAATANKRAKRRADGNTRRADANIVATTNKTAIAHANVMTSNTRAGANIAVTANANKAASNIKKYVPMYRQSQMPM